MKLSELYEASKGALDAPTPTVSELAKKHGVSISVLEKQLEAGIEEEMEHTTDTSVAKEIALDHLSEDPKYYTKLKKIE